MQTCVGHRCAWVQRSRLIEHTSSVRHGLGLHGVVTSPRRYRYRLPAAWRRTAPPHQYAIIVTWCFSARSVAAGWSAVNTTTPILSQAVHEIAELGFSPSPDCNPNWWRRLSRPSSFVTFSYLIPAVCPPHFRKLGDDFIFRNFFVYKCLAYGTLGPYVSSRLCLPFTNCYCPYAAGLNIHHIISSIFCSK